MQNTRHRHRTPNTRQTALTKWHKTKNQAKDTKQKTPYTRHKTSSTRHPTPDIGDKTQDTTHHTITQVLKDRKILMLNQILTRSVPACFISHMFGIHLKRRKMLTNCWWLLVTYLTEWQRMKTATMTRLTLVRRTSRGCSRSLFGCALPTPRILEEELRTNVETLGFYKNLFKEDKV